MTKTSGAIAQTIVGSHFDVMIEICYHVSKRNAFRGFSER